jgi:hypothetical protein
VTASNFFHRIVETLFGKMARTFLRHIRVHSWGEHRDRIQKGIEEILEMSIAREIFRENRRSRQKRLSKVFQVALFSLAWTPPVTSLS